MRGSSFGAGFTGRRVGIEVAKSNTARRGVSLETRSESMEIPLNRNLTLNLNRQPERAVDRGRPIRPRGIKITIKIKIRKRIKRKRKIKRRNWHGRIDFCKNHCTQGAGED